MKYFNRRGDGIGVDRDARRKERTNQEKQSANGEKKRREGRRRVIRVQRAQALMQMSSIKSGTEYMYDGAKYFRRGKRRGESGELDTKPERIIRKASRNDGIKGTEQRERCEIQDIHSIT